jgi:UDP-N-acetylglucosamine 2-epimerase
MEFNFLLKANVGKIKTGKEAGTYVIAVPINNIHSILQYSEKPNKVSKYITAKELLTIWQQSFVTVHPNGSISSNKMQPIAVTFTNVKIKGNNAYFNFTPMHKNTKINTSTPLMVPHVFVDSSGNGKV